MNFEIGQSIGPYRISGILGQGGMGSVYGVEHTITRRVEALKVAARGRPVGAGEDQRFLREIQVQAGLSHPNIASVHNAFWAEGDLVLVMELVDGEPLAAIIARGRPPLDRTIDWVLQLLEALSYAHGRGIIHRDVTPKNMMITREGALKLTDFGVARSVRDAKLTESGAFIGSAYYAAPEQIRGATEPDERADLYSAGVVLYELLTGVRPYEGESAFDIMQAHIAEARPKPAIERNPEIGAELNSVVMRALEKDPAARFQLAADLRVALAAARKGMRYREPLISRLRSAAGKRTAHLAAGLLVAIAAMAAMAIWLGRPPQSAQSAPLPVNIERPSPAAGIIPLELSAAPTLPDAVPGASGSEAFESKEIEPAAAPKAPAAAPPPRPAGARRGSKSALPGAEAEAVAPFDSPAPARIVPAPPIIPAAAAESASVPDIANVEDTAPAPLPPAVEKPKQRHPVIRALRRVLPFGRKKQSDPPKD
ncbi:MAG TPA: serine/threonine-protein kinase [Bryobacteraceae bacterium]|nr:serine/threonine-protein kinase [Bryobacteraceae bacterium]